MVAPRSDALLRYIGANVRRLRIEHGLTQIDLAKKTGLKERYVQVLETGTANPTVKVLNAVARALGVAPGDLFTPAKLETRPAGRPPASD